MNHSYGLVAFFPLKPIHSDVRVVEPKFEPSKPSNSAPLVVIYGCSLFAYCLHFALVCFLSNYSLSEITLKPSIASLLKNAMQCRSRITSANAE